MPQIVGDLVFTAGVTGKVHALKAATGERVWMHDLYTEFGGTRLGFGYSSHPLPYRDKLIVAAGGKGKAVVAINQRSGRVLWSGLSYQNSYNAPLLVNAAGRDQVIVLGAQMVLGVDPRDGVMLWWLPLGTDAGQAFGATPLWDAANQIIIFSGAVFGATALRLVADGSERRAETLWHNARLASNFGNLILAGETMYLSRGAGPAFLTAVDIKTGAMKWSTREFARATMLRADGKLIILDEEGWLALAQPNSDGSLTIRSKVRMLSPNSWTVPTLAGRTLYLRDRKVIIALDVGRH
jgi:outer membrane protein assembly factor BamB